MHKIGRVGKELQWIPFPYYHLTINKCREAFGVRKAPFAFVRDDSCLKSERAFRTPNASRFINLNVPELFIDWWVCLSISYNV